MTITQIMVTVPASSQGLTQMSYPSQILTLRGAASVGVLEVV